ncbi:MAG TPA: PIN domain-containing protein [Phycisphaerae bacterium]|nr:PIN domain-containing protein [Phycisphaerae bacterium]
MRVVSVYVDSSVWNAAFDDHVPDIQKLTESFLAKLAATTGATAYISDVVLAELARAPFNRQAALAEAMRRVSPMRLELDDESADLAEQYIKHGVVTSGHLSDARHVAIATVSKIEVLTSWNYRHLVNRRRRDAFNGVNSIRGYPPIEIISPPEVFDE